MSRTDCVSDAVSALEHEEVRVVRGARTGTTITVAVHSTTRGPAIGGLRIKHYLGWREGVEDVLRLSQAMTMKCALAGLPHGGGKTVAVLPQSSLNPALRTDLITDIAEVIDEFGGRYISGPDIGSTPDDMELIHRLANGSAFCRPEACGGSGNSSPATARGVIAALYAGLRHHYHDESVTGRRVGVIGYGHVGRAVAQQLALDGAHVLVADADSSLRELAESDAVEWTTADLLRAELDVLVPAATGGMLTQEVAQAARAGLIVGPANNQLADEKAGAELHERGITWVPDILASAGGIIHAVSRERLGLDEQSTEAGVEQIGEKTTHLLAYARDHDITPLHAARTIAAQTASEVPA